ncbi:MAG: hypothetical protein RR690_07340 [Longicatena sp.]
MRWLQNFMRGRYGPDQLSFFLLALYLVITIVSSFLRLPILTYLSLILMFWCWFRILSRKTYKRSAENTKFLRMVFPITSRFRSLKKRFRDRKFYKYYKCPSCKQELRVPKGKGEITITCPKCKTKFDKRT